MRSFRPFPRLLTALWFAVALAGIVSSANAEEVPPPQKITLWPDGAPLGDGKTEPSTASITVHLPAPDKANGAAMVICPGGGYGGLMMEPEGHGIARWLNAHGIAGALLEYRLPKGRSLVPLADAQRALRTLRSRAAEWKLDP